MLAGFEDITYELDEYELNTLLPVFVKGFNSHKGKANPITNAEIIELLKSKYIINPARVRKIVNYIRNKNLIVGLIATSKGYYISVDPEEVQKYIKSLTGRENEIKRIREKMQEYLLTL
jgi:uncharacterized protein YutE (UPF0331/DUF86 family)